MSKKLFALSLVAAAAAMPQVAAADTVSMSLTFEDTLDNTFISGKTFSDSNFTIAFSGGGKTLLSADLGGSGLFPGKNDPEGTTYDLHRTVLGASSAPPPPPGATSADASSDITISIAEGVDALSFAFGALVGFDLYVDGKLYSGFASNNTEAGCDDSPFGSYPYQVCNWTGTGDLSFDHLVHTIVFRGAGSSSSSSSAAIPDLVTASFALDDMKFSRTSVTTPPGVPEPATYGLLGLGLVAALATRRRKQ